MKFMAFYLPQYHEIPENNKWWGKGFTDWVNVKKAEKFYPGHNQPRIPLDNNYYDLSRIDDVRNQIKLANEYGIYGFCFYHYWFHGKLLLEKPVKMFLDNPDLNLKFCFSWANESWARTWDGKNRNYLIKQDYGDEPDWIAHFGYFLPYFNDSRYIKINNKPMLVIYKHSIIPSFPQMVDVWNKMARQNGFDGIHLVETLRDASQGDDSGIFDAHVEFEPARANTPSKAVLWKNRVVRYIRLTRNRLFRLHRLCNTPEKFRTVAKRSLSKNNLENTYGGLFLGWDNSPRKKELSTVIQQPTKEEFDSFVFEKIKRNEANNDADNQYIFINAWNEWAEGTYLEPDTVNRYTYLEVLKKYSSYGE